MAWLQNMRESRDHVRFLSELWVGFMMVLFLMIRLVDRLVCSHCRCLVPAQARDEESSRACILRGIERLFCRSSRKRARTTLHIYPGTILAYKHGEDRRLVQESALTRRQREPYGKYDAGRKPVFGER